MTTASNYFLVGRPGVGKTTVLLKIAQRLSPIQIGGFFTQEIRAGAGRVGFRVETFSGVSGTLAHVSRQQGPRVGKYHVDLAAFEQIGAAGLENAVKEAAVILVDEIGKMELFSERFRKAVVSALDSDKPVIATVMASADPFVDALKARADVRVVEVTTDNRDRLPEELAAQLKLEVR
jgi:nucleoside-triphosphatase